MTRGVRSSCCRSALAAPALLVGLLAIAAAPHAVAGELSPQRQREVLQEALAQYDDGVARAHDDPQRSAELFRRSAAHFETLLDAGVRNAALEYNLGNTYMRLADTGRAILHYRRAARLEPGNGRVAANLDYARRRVEPFIEPPARSRLVGSLLFWQYSTSQRQRFWAAAGFSAIGWVLLVLRLRWRATPLVVLGIAAVLLGLTNAGLVAWEQREDADRPPAVIVESNTILRTGGGEHYEPKLNQPLGAGIELRIRNQRGDWIEVELLDGHTGWLPAKALARVPAG